MILPVNRDSFTDAGVCLKFVFLFGGFKGTRRKHKGILIELHFMPRDETLQLEGKIFSNAVCLY